MDFDQPCAGVVGMAGPRLRPTEPRDGHGIISATNWFTLERSGLSASGCRRRHCLTC